jgi:hypothetical protein
MGVGAGKGKGEGRYKRVDEEVGEVASSVEIEVVREGTSEVEDACEVDIEVEGVNDLANTLASEIVRENVGQITCEIVRESASQIMCKGGVVGANRSKMQVVGESRGKRMIGIEDAAKSVKEGLVGGIRQTEVEFELSDKIVLLLD